jgi:effector-binding domain-containing protein
VSDEIRVETVEARRTAVVHRETTWPEFPSLWPQLLDEVYRFLGDSDVVQDGHNVMLYLDDMPTVEVGVAVDRSFEPAATGSVVSSVLPAGTVATTVHRGSYGGLGDAHGAVIAWCRAHGRNLAGPRWEIYGDWHEDESLLETQVSYLLR